MQSKPFQTLDRLSLLPALVISIILFLGITNSQARHETISLLKASVNTQLLGDTEYNLAIQNQQGQLLERSGISVIDDSGIQRSATITLSSLLLALLTFLGVWVILRLISRSTRRVIERKKEIEADNNRLVEAADLRKATADKPCQSRMMFAGIPLPEKADTGHLIVTGAPGAGKSVNIKEVLATLRANGKKAIVFDINGEFISHFYRADKDIILNPMDERSASWDIWCECTRSYDYMRMAKALIPDHAMEKDWSAGARVVLATLAQNLAEQEKPNTKELIRQIRELDDDQIIEILSETDAAPIIAKWGQEQACIGIRGVLISCVAPMEELDSNNYRFSVRRWSFNESDDSWLFVSTHSDEIDVLRPLTTVWMEFACSTLMSLSPDHLRRFFVVIDDITQLNQIPSLQNFMIQSRKIGACAVLGIDSLNRMTEIYGMGSVQSISRSCENWAALRSSDYTTSKWISNKLGRKNTLQTTEITYSGKNEKQTTQKQLSTPIITPEQLHELPDLHGFVRVGGENYPVAKFNSVARSWPVIAQPFIARTNSNIEEMEAIEEELLSARSAENQTQTEQTQTEKKVKENKQEQAA